MTRTTVTAAVFFPIFFAVVMVLIVFMFFVERWERTQTEVRLRAARRQRRIRQQQQQQQQQQQRQRTENERDHPMAIFTLDEQQAIYAQVFRTKGCLITLTDEHFNSSSSSSRSSSNIETKANHIDEDPKPDRCDDIEFGMLPPKTTILATTRSTRTRTKPRTIIPPVLTRNDAGGERMYYLFGRISTG